MGGYVDRYKGWTDRKAKEYGEFTPAKRTYYITYPARRYLDSSKIDPDHADQRIGGCVVGVLTHRQFDQVDALQNTLMGSGNQKQIDRTRKQLDVLVTKHQLDMKCYDDHTRVPSYNEPGGCALFLLKDVTRTKPDTKNRKQVRVVADCAFRDPLPRYLR